MSCQGPTLVSEGGGSILAGTAPVGTVGRHELVAQGSSMGLGSGVAAQDSGMGLGNGVAAQGSRMGLGSGVEAQGSNMGLGSSTTARTAARSSSASITTLQKTIEETTMNMEATLDLIKDSSTLTWSRKCEVKSVCKARTKSLDRGLFLTEDVEASYEKPYIICFGTGRHHSRDPRLVTGRQRTYDIRLNSSLVLTGQPGRDLWCTANEAEDGAPNAALVVTDVGDRPVLTLAMVRGGRKGDQVLTYYGRSYPRDYDVVTPPNSAVQLWAEDLVAALQEMNDGLGEPTAYTALERCPKVGSAATKVSDRASTPTPPERADGPVGGGGAEAAGPAEATEHDHGGRPPAVAETETDTGRGLLRGLIEDGVAAAAQSTTVAAAAVDGMDLAPQLSSPIGGSRLRALGHELSVRREQLASLSRRVQALMAEAATVTRGGLSDLAIELLDRRVRAVAGGAALVSAGVESSARGDTAPARLPTLRPLRPDEVLRAEAQAGKPATLVEARAKLLAAIDAEKQASVGDEEAGDDTTEARRVYQTSLDSTGETAREDQPDEKAIYFKVRRGELHDLLETTDQSPLPGAAVTQCVDLFKVQSEDSPRFQSLKACLIIRGKGGRPVPVSAVVDTGAAYCGMALGFLRRELPEFESRLQPTTMRFRDAQKHLMKTAGTLLLPLEVGGAKITATVIVFTSLGADLLLGVNALYENGLVVDVAGSRMYTSGHPENSVHLEACSGCREGHASCCGKGCANFGAKGATLAICSSSSKLIASCEACEGSVHCTGAPAKPKPRPTAKLTLLESSVVPAGETVILAAEVNGVEKGRLTTLEVAISSSIAEVGLVSVGEMRLNPTLGKAPLVLMNPTDRDVTLWEGMLAAYEIEDEDEDYEEHLILKVGLEYDDQSGAGPRPLDEGGMEDLWQLGFNLEKSVDPTKRNQDGSYQLLDPQKKRRLYEIAHRWWYVWSKDAKVPQLSYLVLLDIPTGNAEPVQQQPYPIPVKLRKAAMEEVNKLLRAGLIAPSLSNWAAPTLVRMKKDSTPEDIKVKLACDYRRLNAVTTIDAGGLGSQSDILYGLGGTMKWVALCDAAGGFYQYALHPRARHKSAFILPTSMGGTLFEWVVAPYGLTRNPAGYSRGMQFVLKGLCDRDDLGASKQGKGGVSSWVDDVCFRADSFEAFEDLFETVLSRLAIAGMTLKGTKCDILLPSMDLLGYLVTPEGLRMQPPKLEELTGRAVPDTPDEIRKFLGAVAFLRRFVPRLSLLSAPMTNVLKKADKVQGKAKMRGRSRGPGYIFTEEDCASVEDSFRAIVSHLSSDAVVSGPDLEDPLAEFVLVTDACDVAVGGSLLQWQHPSGRGPGPPEGTTVRNLESKDPVQSSWRLEKGWTLKVIGYFSKTLADSQKNYTAFDKEAAAILLCVRHWSDLITYHPTTVFTDSAVAASMIHKHLAPPRLQRWGMELGTYLPHLRIGYRKGANNGLADLLSRFPTFRRFVKTRPDIELPDDQLEYMGNAPLFTHRLLSEEDRHLGSASYELYVPAGGAKVPDTKFWQDPGGLEIPGRGFKDRFSSGETAFVADSTAGAEIAAMMEVLNEPLNDSDLSEGWSVYVKVFEATTGRRPTVCLEGWSAAQERLASSLWLMGFEVTDDPDADVCFAFGESLGECVRRCRLRGGRWLAVGLTEQCDGPDSGTIEVLGRILPCESSTLLDFSSLQRHAGRAGALAPERDLVLAACQLLSRELSAAYGVPVWDPRSLAAHQAAALENWAEQGYLAGYPSIQFTDEVSAEDYHDEPCGSCSGVGGEAEVAEVTAELESGDAPPLSVRVTREEQQKDPELERKRKVLDGSVRLSAARASAITDSWELHAGKLYRRTFTDGGEDVRALAVPSHMRAAILALHHYPLSTGGGHRGGRQLYDAIRTSYYWKGMERHCHVFSDSCQQCASTRSQPNVRAPMGTSATPEQPFQVIHIDHKGPLKRVGNYMHILVVVCALTRFTLYLPVASTTSQETLDVLIKHVFCVFGFPLAIVADNGPAMRAQELMTAAEKMYGFRRIFVKPGTPMANGLAEAAVKRIKLILDRHTRLHSNWPAVLPMAQFLLNSRSHTAHGISPFTALFGRSPTPLAAIENPELLPSEVDGDEFVRELSHRLRILHRSLAAESDLIKQAAAEVYNRQHGLDVHSIVAGDEVWLTPGTTEHAAYVRKHGHGAPWRFKYTVLEVKPHAVRLDMADCGDAPRLEEWQSVRKCTRVKPVHDELDSAAPYSDEYGRVLAGPDETIPSAPLPSQESEEVGESRYLIERVLRAEPRGRGWVVYVKWLDYDDVTAEPVSAIVRDTRGDPDILNQINDAQRRYRDEHPVRVLADGSDLPAPIATTGGQNPPASSDASRRPTPARVVPARRARPTHFHVEHVVCPAYRDLACVHALRARARVCFV